MDLKLSGSGVVPAGEYDLVSLSGAVVLSGDIKCRAFSASGSLKGEKIECANDVMISGAVKLTKDISAEKITVSGSFACGSVKCQNVSVKGAVTVDGDLGADESVVLSGAVFCRGPVFADRVSIVFDTQTQIDGIRGVSVSVAPARIKKLIPPLIKNACVATAVEGDDVSLAYVTCPRVAGKHVVIGKGCEIDLVQYSETVEISRDAKVGKIEKI